MSIVSGHSGPFTTSFPSRAIPSKYLAGVGNMVFSKDLNVPVVALGRSRRLSFNENSLGNVRNIPLPVPVPVDGSSSKCSSSCARKKSCPKTRRGFVGGDDDKVASCGSSRSSHAPKPGRRSHRDEYGDKCLRDADGGEETFSHDIPARCTCTRGERCNQATEKRQSCCAPEPASLRALRHLHMLQVGSHCDIKEEDHRQPTTYSGAGQGFLIPSYHGHDVDLTSDKVCDSPTMRNPPKEGTGCLRRTSRGQTNYYPTENDDVLVGCQGMTMKVDHIPHTMNLAFQPQNDMNLSPVEMAVAAYVFCRDLPPG
ncbi:hypothetical protein AHAS_Ahas02G0200900 [Arachis hypogaea]